jgi:hypothetical protein
MAFKRKSPCSGSERYCNEGKRAGFSFFLANFRHLATKKKGWLIQQRDF